MRFTSDAETVRRASWQRVDGPLARDPRTTQESFTDLAERGLFRSFVLRVNDTPCAFLFGFQSRGVYYVNSLGYDAAFSRYSPGIAIVFLALQALFDEDRPRLVSLGSGDAEYKRRLSNASFDEGTLFLLRRTESNRLRAALNGSLGRIAARLSREARRRR
jgi:CelD/BcsL family acetyltransferase involved in cellulose biosynthesis